MLSTSHATAPSESGTGARRVDLGAQSRVGAVLDEVPIAERPVAEPNGSPDCERVVAAHGQDEGVVAQLGGGQPGPIDRPVDEGDVQFAVGHRPRQGAGRPVGQSNGDAGMGLPEPRERGGQIDHAQRLNGPDVQLASQDTPQTCHRVATLVGGGQALPSGRKERPSGLRQGDPAVVPHEEGLPELAFESLDRHAQARLHDVDTRQPARVKCNSSATATKCSSWRSSIDRSYRWFGAKEYIGPIHRRRPEWEEHSEDQPWSGPWRITPRGAAMADVVTSDTTIDTHGMVVIHRAFRRESRVAEELVTAVPDGDTGERPSSAAT